MTRIRHRITNQVTQNHLDAEDDEEYQVASFDELRPRWRLVMVDEHHGYNIESNC